VEFPSGADTPNPRRRPQFETFFRPLSSGSVAIPAPHSFQGFSRSRIKVAFVRPDRWACFLIESLGTGACRFYAVFSVRVLEFLLQSFWGGVCVEFSGATFYLSQFQCWERTCVRGLLRSDLDGVQLYLCSRGRPFRHGSLLPSVLEFDTCGTRIFS